MVFFLAQKELKKNDKYSIQILIVEPNEIIRYGLQKLTKVYFEDAAILATDSLMDNKLPIEVCPDLIVLEINYGGMSNLGLIEKLRSRYINSGILVFTALFDSVYAIECFNLGALGYIHKNATTEEIVHAMKIVKSGSYCFSKEVIDGILKLTDSGEIKKRGLRLSHRELMVAEMLSNGEGVLNIANQLKLKVGTVSTYKIRLFRKLRVNNVIELARKIKLH